jgi:transcriptional regulator with XRE-family HTH domain
MLDIAVNMSGRSVGTLYRMETMGNRIKRLREARNLTVQELADKVGVSRSLVYQWEDDSVAGIRPANFVLLCQTLKTDPAYLVWGADRSPQMDNTAAR